MANIELSSPVEGEIPRNEDAGGAVKMQRRLTLLDGVTLIVGTIIGSGIFVSPAGVYETTRSVGTSLIVWCLSGLLSILGALCYAELGTSITRSGGDYAYIYVAFGPLAAFLRLWMAILIIRPTTQTIIALTFAQYAVKPFFPECDPPESAVRLLAAVCLCLLTAVNCISVRWAMKIQNIFTVAKLAALASIVLVGLYYICSGRVENFQNAFEGNYHPSKLALAFYSGMFAFGGWNQVNFVVEELQNPYKNLPRTIWIALPIVTAAYVLANIAYFAVLTGEEMISSAAVAVTFGDKTFGKFTWLVPVFVALSCFGGVNGVLFSSSRLFLIGAQEGHLPDVISFIHVDRFTPIPALLFTCITSLAMLLISDVFVLINYFSQILWFSVAASIGGMLWLRHKHPETPRPIRVHTSIPVIFLGCCTFLILFPIADNPWNTVIGVGITLLGIPVYYLCIRYQNKPEKYHIFVRRFTEYLQKILGIALPQMDQKLS